MRVRGWWDWEKQEIGNSFFGSRSRETASELHNMELKACHSPGGEAPGEGNCQCLVPLGEQKVNSGHRRPVQLMSRDQGNLYSKSRNVRSNRWTAILWDICEPLVDAWSRGRIIVLKEAAFSLNIFVCFVVVVWFLSGHGLWIIVNTNLLVWSLRPDVDLQ